jgi:hypothetical protein
MIVQARAAATHVDATDPVLRYRGAVSLQRVDDGVAPWRIPHTDAELYLPTGGVGRAAMTSGVRLTFRTASSWLRVFYRTTQPPQLKGPPERCNADVLADGQLVDTVTLDAGGRRSSFLVDGLPSRLKTIEIWLPCYSQFQLCAVHLAPEAAIAPDTRTSPRWVHYGSSESQARGASSPSRAWTAKVALTAPVDLTNVAMGGGCHLQPLFATLIRDLPADLLSCVVGANAYGLGSLNEHSFQPNLIGFVRLIRERHPTTPLVVISPIYAPEREDSPRAGGLTLRGFREETATAVAALRRHGDAHVHYLDGLSLFGPGDRSLFLEPSGIEQLHPGPLGHDLVAKRFIGHLTGLGLLPSATGTDHGAVQ